MMLKKVLYPGREEPNTMYVKLFGERKLVYHHTNYYFKMQMIPKKDISEILLFINPHKKFLLNCDNLIFDGLLVMLII